MRKAGRGNYAAGWLRNYAPPLLSLAFGSASSCVCVFFNFFNSFFMYLFISLCLVRMVEGRKEEGEIMRPGGCVTRRPPSFPLAYGAVSS